MGHLCGSGAERGRGGCQGTPQGFSQLACSRYVSGFVMLCLVFLDKPTRQHICVCIRTALCGLKARVKGFQYWSCLYDRRASFSRL
jgi:hypothetical protein